MIVNSVRHIYELIRLNYVEAREVVIFILPRAAGRARVADRTRLPLSRPQGRPCTGPCRSAGNLRAAEGLVPACCPLPVRRIPPILRKRRDLPDTTSGWSGFEFPCALLYPLSASKRPDIAPFSGGPQVRPSLGKLFQPSN